MVKPPLRIAVVDDAQDSAEMIEFWLQANGYLARSFVSGEDFLKVFNTGAFDVLLLDLAMPHMTGFDVYNRVRKIDEKIAIVAVSANVQNAYKELALEYGFNGFIEKPILDLSEFCGEVTRHATGRGED